MAKKSFKISIGLALFAQLTLSASAAPRQMVAGHVPKEVKELNLKPTGSLSDSDHLTLYIGLPLRNQEELTNLLNQVYDPASTNFHRYLTPEKFTDQFGPSQRDYDK